MAKIETLYKMMKEPRKLIKIIGDKKLLNWIRSETYLKLVFFGETKLKLNLENPILFNEKIQWLKLYDYKEIYSVYSDKYAVRAYIKDTIGEEYLIPLIGVYDSIDEINWTELPMEFVLKCTHGSGANIVCKDKSQLDYKKANNKLKFWMNKNWYWFGRELTFKNIKPRIICEMFMIGDDILESLTDYKFYCFNGKSKYCQVIKGRGKNETIDFYDRDWNHMEFNGLRNLPQSTKKNSKPGNYDKMLKLAEKLCENLIFVRVDLYNIKNKIYFGELTLYPTSGFGQFYPARWNKILGDELKLPYE